MRTALPVVVFLLFLGLWTWKLLEPNPVPDTVGEAIPTDLKFLVAKALHLGAYAFLTVLAATLPVGRAGFRAAVAVLALHAAGTEIGQTYVSNRHGAVRDVVINWVGIGFGLALLRAWRLTLPLSPSSANPLSAGRPAE